LLVGETGSLEGTIKSMCGFVGYFDTKNRSRIDKALLARMTDKLIHRGPDSSGFFIEEGLGLGFRRLSIIDREAGDQPLYNEDGSIVLVCNGEIFNYLELRESLRQKQHVFRTNSDVEVLPHLYEEYGSGLLHQLNGQFAFAIYDRNRKMLFLARDHFGVNPLFYTLVDGLFIFASEIKAILEHPLVPREVDLTGLDQIMTFPGLVSPTTMFNGIRSLQSGHYIKVAGGEITTDEYWDLDYPRVNTISNHKPESYYIDELKRLLAQSVKYRLQADVPVGFYLSGGLDSSLIGALISQVSPGIQRHSFSIGFTEREISESKYQRAAADHVKSVHHEIIFEWPDISRRLSDVIYHCECPVKETYNTCSMALSEAARKAGMKVILTGEGADELFAGYVGYRFDRANARVSQKNDLDAILEDELRERVWGDRNLFYEEDLYAWTETKKALYSAALLESFDSFDCLQFELVNKARLQSRDSIHQRSYLDFKLRLADHLLSDHGDRMALSNSVEARYPFLDINLVEFSREIPPELKLNLLSEKYILKKAAEGMIPRKILLREKYGFHAPGSPYLLQQNIEWVNDLLSYETIKRQGYFNPAVVERLKLRYSQPGFKLNLPFEKDLLIIVLTYGLFLNLFGLRSLN
jgi:asparagine synthase (glutamine-hydrolysing)